MTRSLPKKITSPVVVRAAVGAGLALLVLVLTVSSERHAHPPALGAGDRPDSCIGAAAACPPDYSLLVQPDEALAQKYSPILALGATGGDDCNGGDAFLPLPVDAVLNNPEVALRRIDGPGYLKLGASAADLFEAGPAAYLDFPGSPTGVDCRYERDSRRFQADSGPVTYAHLVRQPGTGELALQYWFFYYFNDGTARHEGDWEMIQVIFKASTSREALGEEPLRVDYAQHNGGEVASWSDRKLVRRGDHPVVFVAAGSHSSHFQPGVYIGRGENRSGFGCDNAASDLGSLVEPRVQLLPHQSLSASDAEAWLAFSGSWGELPGGEFDAPTGPIRKWQWWGPLDWEHHSVRQSSVRAPSPEAFGSDAVSAFCDAVTFSSRFVLPHVIERPFASAVFFGLAGIGAVSSLTRTRYLPVRGLPLRSHRRRGQVLSSALDLYRQRASLVAAIGLLAVPVTLVLPGFRWQPPAVLPFGHLLDFEGVVLAQRLATSFALASIQLGLIYAVVTAASIAAVASTEAPGRTGAGAVMWRVWKALPDLVLPRFCAAAAVAALSLSVGGIPLALRQAVRWAFIEQAVLLDGKSGRAAMAESARVVEGRWWRAFGMVALFGVAALLAPYLFATVLMLLFRSAPLPYVNLAASAIYACLVPYLAIALTLSYLDLRSR